MGRGAVGVGGVEVQRDFPFPTPNMQAAASCLVRIHKSCLTNSMLD